jgi:hypothetical protein
MDKKAIIIIGAGQLGSRHLQALSLLDFGADVFVVEPDKANRDRARVRWEEVAARTQEISPIFHANMEDLPNEAFLAIIATNSLDRRAAIESLLDRTQVDYLILEKFLFPRLSDYAPIGELLDAKCVRAYVNCPRRMFPDYRKIREISLDSPISRIVVSGGNWGLGCNAIHYIDLIAFLSGCDDFVLGGELSPDILESKRPGYREFVGAISGKFSVGVTFRLEALPEISTPTLIMVQSRKRGLMIAEAARQYFVATEENGYRFDERPFVMEMQSTLTARVALSLAMKGTCDLTPYVASANHHRRLLRLFMDHYAVAHGASEILCPIT